MPELDLGHRETPTPLNPLGVKGIGEFGVLPIPAAIASAVENALSPFGVRIRQFPIRPRDLSEMLKNAAWREASSDLYPARGQGCERLAAPRQQASVRIHAAIS